MAKYSYFRGLFIQYNVAFPMYLFNNQKPCLFATWARNLCVGKMFRATFHFENVCGTKNEIKDGLLYKKNEMHFLQRMCLFTQ